MIFCGKKKYRKNLQIGNLFLSTDLLTFSAFYSFSSNHLPMNTLIFRHYIFIISQLWLTSHPRSTVVLLDTGTPATSREIYNYKPSALAIELTSSKAIAGKELSLSSWCISSLYIYHFSTVADKLNSCPAIAFELVSSMARALGL